MSLAFAVPNVTLWRDELWDTILDLSALLDAGTWVLVGGQAVVAHSLALEVDDDTRAASDSDPIGRLVTTGSGLPTVLRAFSWLGFRADGAQPPIATRFRYTREADRPSADSRAQVWTIDVCAGDALHARDQALDRRVPYQATKGMRAPLIPVPDLVSTVIYEAAQFAIDTADPFLHARDAAFLVSLIDDPVAARSRLTPADRRALRVLDAAVGARSHHVWSRLPFHRDAFTKWRLLLAV